jgi:hypothetical protein
MIPNEVEFVQPKSFNIKQGCSALSITNLAKSKGYQLVEMTFTNLIFVHEDYKEQVIGPAKPSLNDLRDDSNIKMFIFSGMDGTILSNKNKIISMCHGTGRYVSDMQALPKFLRYYSGDYGVLQNIAIKIYQAIFALKYLIHEPDKFKAKFKAKFKK